MKARTWIAIVFVLLSLAVLGILAWLPFDPLEEPAGPIDTVVPSTVDSAWRFDGPALLRSPFARAVWNRKDVVELRAAADVEGKILRPLRRIETAFTAASLGLADAPTMERDLVPAEVIVATRGDDVLVVSRISSRARAIEFVRVLDPAAARQLGLSVEGPHIVIRQTGHPALYLARHRDILFASTSPAMVADATTVASHELGGLSAVDGASEALGIGSPAGERILGWVRPRPLAQRLAPDETDPPWWAALLRADDAAPVRMEIGLGEPDALGLTVRAGWVRGLPEALAPVRPVATGAGGPLPAVSAGAGEEFVAGGLAIPAGSVLRALLGSQPPERQDAFDAALAAAGESVESLADSLAAHFEGGVGFSVGRLREADTLLGGPDAGALKAIPCTMVTFRLRGPGADRALLAELHARSETLFGSRLGDSTEILGDGTRIHTLARQGLAGQWDLLRPAFAFRGTTFVFSTHDAALRRALAPQKAGGAAAPSVARGAVGAPAAPAAGRTLTANLTMGPLRAWVADQAWEAADTATWRDWREERLRIEASLASGSPIAREDRATYLDARIRELKKTRREREIPLAVDEFKARFTWLDRLGDAQFGADVGVASDGSGEVTLRVRLTPSE